jgi:hypothetical protein
MPLIQDYGREPGYPKYKVSSGDSQTTASYQDRWKILVTDETALGEAILAEMPTDFRIGTPFGTQTWITEQSLDRDKTNRLLYYLDITTSNQQPDPQAIPPDQRRASWAWDFETIGMALLYDADTGAPVVNKVGEPFEIEYDAIIPVLTIERWELQFDPDTIINLVNHRNSGVFWGAPAGSAVCAGIRDREDSQQTLEGQPYRKVTYTFKFRVPDVDDEDGFPVVSGWKEIIQNQGTFYYVSASATPKVKRSFTTDTGGHTKGQLTNDGEKLSEAATPVKLNFNKYPQANFDSYGLNIFQL